MVCPCLPLKGIMINRLIEVSLENRGIVLAAYAVLAIWGAWALRSASVDAIPDLSDNQVIVFTDWPGHGAREVEDQITYGVRGDVWAASRSGTARPKAACNGR